MKFIMKVNYECKFNLNWQLTSGTYMEVHFSDLQKYKV